MKLLFVLAALVAAVSALPVDDRVNGENGWFIPKLDGNFEWMDMADAEELLSGDDQMEGRISTNAVNFYLYTKSNPTSRQEIKSDASSISGSHFNRNHGTRFVIHGWTQSAQDDMNTRITKAWLSRGDYNVIVVDWARARSVDYASSVLAVPGAGAKVGDMIRYLNEQHGMSLDSLEVIGHSLGAHVAGYAGKTVGSGRIHAIVGLDPALPLFSYDSPNKRLNSNDAWYVESIQTNGGTLGFLKPIGKGAFYPNGGKTQPGCGLDLTGSCSHGRSVTYYAEAVTQDNFGSIKCGNYEAAVNNQCGSTYSSVRMGGVTNAYMVSGDYYVPVNSAAPFGKVN
ncbi:pancreatic triacylglycerol lipase-like isoform X6 [Drosophila guanche]|uniref:Blast:Pancreatic triacylglycerol lipase n=1 Tax=Drosophila guanche TaxID=7266 RepID=A0A3B0JIJ1_DROGU|nr:pancreatic triacylglycerol lipase-like isoform X6 [Drosophila guanche]SPP80543.1 blast:Pancreatic triacylglycerol lipase [Drosophila guanche]